MDWPPRQDCGTPFVQSRMNLRSDIERFEQYRHMLVPWLEKAGVTYRQFTLIWATGIKGPKTVANLAAIAQIDLETALDDIRALECDGLASLEAPPWQFDTPEVETTGRYGDIRRVLAPALYRLEGFMRRYPPDSSHPWQGPPPRV